MERRHGKAARSARCLGLRQRLARAQPARLHASLRLPSARPAGLPLTSSSSPIVPPVHVATAPLPACCPALYAQVAELPSSQAKTPRAPKRSLFEAADREEGSSSSP